jgi:hypothetical protein
MNEIFPCLSYIFRCKDITKIEIDKRLPKYSLK